ncbi:hypothetical protein Avbf_10563 [Armadillidium vulgare]|nr:hypothetical protein Avbf_10563 [Armadillidium vulgare]
MNCYEASHLSYQIIIQLAPCPPAQFLICPLPGINGGVRIPPPCGPCSLGSRCCFDGCFNYCRPYPVSPSYNRRPKGGCSKCRGKK